MQEQAKKNKIACKSFDLIEIKLVKKSAEGVWRGIEGKYGEYL